MCGRFVIEFTWSELAKLLDVTSWPTEELVARYNVAPTQRAPVVRACVGGGREGVMMRWGLEPAWAAGGLSPKPFNARGETVFEKAMFKAAARERRCLVPVSGFYEWQAVPGRKGKQPHFICRRDRGVMVLAGVWNPVRGASEDSMSGSFTILTVPPNRLMSQLHDRMPVLLGGEQVAAWLDVRLDVPAARSLVRTYELDDLVAYPVSDGVNTTARDDPGLLLEATSKTQGEQQPPGLFDAL